MFLFAFFPASAILLAAMLTIPKESVLRRMGADSPWWKDRDGARRKEASRRDCFASFFGLISNRNINRAAVLMGPPGAGKTVMIHQAVAELIRKNVEPERIVYVPLDNPVYAGLSLEEIVFLSFEAGGEEKSGPRYFFFDEIQYLRDWPRHLKSLVDSCPQHRFAAAASAMPALKLKSGESGAGRFAEFVLPPPMFREYMRFSGRGSGDDVLSEFLADPEKTEDLNREFADYLSFGGLPEDAGGGPRRFAGNDFIEKTLLRDLPSLYGIRDIRRLNRLFVLLAACAGQEIDLRSLSRRMSIAKGTALKCLEYLEAAFLIKRVSRIDRTGRRFRREHRFKVYITNPSMYSSLFGPLTEDDPAVFGQLAETAVFCHFFRFADFLEKPYYARWRNGEVGLVVMDPVEAKTAVEIRWSDGPFDGSSRIRGLLAFAEEHKITGSGRLVCCTKNKSGLKRFGNKEVLFVPASLFCLLLGQSPDSRRFRELLAGLAAESGGRTDGMR